MKLLQQGQNISEPNAKISSEAVCSLELAMHTAHENALRQNLKHNQLFCKSTTTPKL
jgi:hypothetical protein